MRLISNHLKSPLGSNVQSSYIPNSSLFQATVYSVGVSKVRSLYTQINVCISVKLCCVVTKIGTRIRLYSYTLPVYQISAESEYKHLQVRADFVICAKRRRRRKKTRTKTETLISRILETPGVIYFNFGIQPLLIGTVGSFTANLVIFR